MSIIQQLEDLKEWAQNPERYERRLAFRSNNPMGTEAGTIPIEFDELSPQEQDYYQNPPFSTHSDFLGAKGGQVIGKPGGLVEPGITHYGTDEKIIGTNQFGEPITLDDLTKKQKRLLRNYKKLSGKEPTRQLFLKIHRGDYTEKSLYDPQNPWMADEKSKKLAAAIEKANDGDKYIKPADLRRKTLGKSRVYFKGADKLFETLDTQQDKVDKVFKRIMESDDAVPKYINHYISDLTGIGRGKTITGYLRNNKAYAQNEKLIDYLGRTNLVKTDLSDMSFRQQLDFAEDSLKGRTKFTGLPKGGSWLFRDANLDIMQFAKRNWDQNKGQGIIKFYNRKTGREIKWKPGGKLALKGVSFTYGKDAQKYNFKYLRESGKKNPLFKDIYRNRQAINDMLNSYVDDPFNKGKKTRFGKLMRNVYYEGFGYAPNTAIMDLGHGPGGVKAEPFKYIDIQSKRLNVALRDIDKIPLKGLKDKILNEALGTLKGKTGAQLVEAIKAQQLDLAKQVAGGARWDRSLRLESTEKVIRKGDLGPKSFSYAIDKIMKLKKGDPLYTELMKYCPKGKNKGGVAGSCSIEEATTGLKNELSKVKGNPKLLSKFSKIGRLGGVFFGWVDAPIEFAFALPGLLRGDKDEALRNTTLGLFGAGGTEFEKLEPGTALHKRAKEVKDIQKYIDNFYKAKDLKSYLDDTANIPLSKSEQERRSISQKQFDDIITETQNISEGLSRTTLAEQVQARKELKAQEIASAKEGITITDVPFAGDVKFAPYGKPKDLSNIEDYIKYKGDPFYKAYEAADEELGIDPSLQDTFYEKDIRDRYIDLPLDIASQLGSFEKQELEELMRRKKEKELLRFLPVPFAEYGPSILRGVPSFFGFDEGGRVPNWKEHNPFANMAGGGIATLHPRRPKALPPTSGPDSQGLAYLNNYATKRTE